MFCPTFGPALGDFQRRFRQSYRTTGELRVDRYRRRSVAPSSCNCARPCGVEVLARGNKHHVAEEAVSIRPRKWHVSVQPSALCTRFRYCLSALSSTEAGRDFPRFLVITKTPTGELSVGRTDDLIVAKVELFQLAILSIQSLTSQNALQPPVFLGG